MGEKTFTTSDYVAARTTYKVTDRDVTRVAEQRARDTGHLSELVDPALPTPIRESRIRLNPHGKQWIVTLGCPMDIEVTCDTTGSMGGEVDTEMRVLPDLYKTIAEVLPDYDPQLCLGIFGDCNDRFAMCRPQFEMEAAKIVRALKEMAPQRAGGDGPEDPQYAMFARAFLTKPYTNRIGLKGYHFVVTDATCHSHVDKGWIKHIFGEKIFENELKDMEKVPSLEETIQALKDCAHQFILIVGDDDDEFEFWSNLCGEGSVIQIGSTKQLPVIISAIIGLTEGTLDVSDISRYLGSKANPRLVSQLSGIDIGAQARLRHALPHPIPKKGDIFRKKSDLWPIQPGELVEEEEPEEKDEIEYV